MSTRRLITLACVILAGLGSVKTSFAQFPDDPQIIQPTAPTRLEPEVPEQVVPDSLLVESILGKQAPGSLLHSVAQRAWLDQVLRSEIRLIDRHCGLDSDQKAKLELAGRGDISHWLPQYIIARQKFHILKYKEIEPFLFVDEVEPLRSRVQTGLFHEGSLFYKSAKHLLDTEKYEKYKAECADKRLFTYRFVVYYTIENLNWSLGIGQHSELFDLAIDETKPPALAISMGPLEACSEYQSFVLYQLAQIPREKYLRFLSNTQWAALSVQLRRADQMRDYFLRAGFLTDSRNEGSK